MRRSLINKGLLLFVILYLIGGFYFYVVSSGGSDVEDFRDFDDPEVGYPKHAYIDPELEAKLESENKNVVIEYSDRFKRGEENGIRNPEEELEIYQRNKNHPAGEIKNQKDVADAMRVTENLRPRKLMTDKQFGFHRKRRQFRKQNLGLVSADEFTNLPINLRQTGNLSNLTFTSETFRMAENERIEEEQLKLGQELEKKAREYIKKKFLPRIKQNEDITDLRNSSVPVFKADSAEFLKKISILESALKGMKVDDTHSSDKNNTETTEIAETESNIVFPPSSFPTENLNNLQVFRGVYIYSAFLDDRKDQAFVRIVMISRSNKNAPQLWCHFRSVVNPSDAASVSDLVFYETCENHMKEFAAYVGSCAVPDIGVDTSFVILSNSAIQGSGLTVGIDVIHNKFRYGYRHKFTTCVPPLFGNVTALRLAEFVEMSQILGVEHFVFYFDNINKEVQKLLFYYAHVGIATALPWNMTLSKRELWYHGQSAAVWDCLFRTMFISELVSFNDIDEFLIPQKHRTWNEMFIELQKSHPKVKVEHVAAYRFYSAFFDPAFKRFAPIESTESSQLLTLNITTRTSQFSKLRTKMIVYPTRVFELGIHHLSKPMEEHFRCLTVETNFAILNHYRNCDWNFGMNCANVQEDATALKYRDILLKNVKVRLMKANEFLKKTLSNA